MICRMLHVLINSGYQLVRDKLNCLKVNCVFTFKITFRIGRILYREYLMKMSTLVKQ